MNRKLTYYQIVWTLLVILFNLISFITPVEKTGSFWWGYIFVMIALFLHLSLFVSTSRRKVNLTTTILTLSCIQLGVMMITGSLFIFVSGIKPWISILVCYGVLAFSIVTLTLTKTVTEHKDEANECIVEKTSTIRKLVDKAALLVSSANETDKNEFKKIYEALRYSDPVSSSETEPLENKIDNCLTELSGLNDNSKLETDIITILMLIEERNNICRQSKRKK